MAGADAGRWVTITPDTLIAATNAATSLRLLGRSQEAEALNEQFRCRLRGCERVPAAQCVFRKMSCCSLVPPSCIRTLR